MTRPRVGRILLLTRYFPPPDGGAQRRYANLCRHFPPESIEVCTSRGDPRGEFDRRQPFTVRRVPVEPLREKNLQGLIPWLATALWRASRGDVGVLWVGNLRRLGRVAWAVKRLTGVPYGVTFYGLDVISLLNQPPRGWKGALARRILEEASFLLANSEFIASLAREYAARIGARQPGERLQVIRSGADLERFRGDADPARCRHELGLGAGQVVLTVARLIPMKGVANALLAFARVAPGRPDAAYVIVGRGDQKEKLRELARELGLEGRVRILDGVPYERMPVLYAAADVFLLTSRGTRTWTENFPNAVLEAMASGKPVVAGNVGGVPEMVAHGETGFLVDPEDVRAIAAALARLLDDRALREAMGRAGRARAEREFSHADVARRIYGVMARASRLPLPPWGREAGRPEAAVGRLQGASRA